jgi:hypothetical protein
MTKGTGMLQESAGPSLGTYAKVGAGRQQMTGISATGGYTTDIPNSSPFGSFSNAIFTASLLLIK